MQPLQPPPTHRYTHNIITNTRLARRIARAVLLMIVIAFAGTLAAMPGSSAAPSSGATPRVSAPAPRASVAGTLDSTVAPQAAPAAARFSSNLWSPAPMPFQASSEAVTIYASDCATPKAVPVEAALGETICIKVANAPFGASRILRRLVVAHPLNFVEAQADIISGAQTALFTFPSNPTTTVGGFDNRGPWIVGTVDTGDATLVRSVFVNVHDPAQLVADLTISKIQNGTGTAAGTNVSYQIYVWNRGPDSASNVHFSDNTLPNTTFVSLTQDSGPTFTCATPTAGTPGTSTCARASFARGDAASFTAVYHVNSNVGNGADLADTATVASDTFDQSSTSNSSDVTTTASNPTPPNCTITCPNNITQASDPGQAGAIVNFNDPATAGTCGALTTDHGSGSFFPIGTTVVTANVADGTANGASCSFTVIVTDNRPVSISLNGASEMTVECRTGFSDPGATASSGATVTTTVTKASGDVDSNGDPINPTTVSAVDPNTPADYTITYSATIGSNTSTVVRVVHVVDTAPPDITLAGIGGLTSETTQVTVTNDDGTTSTVTETILVGTVECHTGFTPPTATAADGCDNHAVPVTTTGAVDPNTPGDYEIVYAATDNAGNDTDRRVRIHVVDTTAPVITLNGASPMMVECHTSFTDPGASASDGCEGPTSVTASGAVNANTPGSYTITYTSTDGHNNTATKTRTVNVVDTTAPVITINGATPVTVECHTSYTDAGATAADSCNGPVPVTAASNVNVNAPGTYQVTYTATDAAGNTATATRTVNVVDTQPPTINCQANILVDFNPAVGGAVVTYPAPVGTDNCAGTITATQIAGLPSGATFPLGTTTNTFKVTDAGGLTASCSFKVNVALSSIVGLDSVSISGAGPVDSYDSNGGYPATKGSLANVLSNGTITLTGSAKVSGNVRSTRAGVVMSGASLVTGNATAGTTVAKSGSASVGGTTTNNQSAPVIALPAVPTCGPPYSSNSGISGSYSYNASTGDLNLTGVNVATLANGTYCFHNVSVGNSAQLKVNGLVTIKLTGTLSAGGAGSLANMTAIPGNLRILSSYSGSNGVSFTNSASAYLVVYAPQTGVTISGAAPLFGTVAGKSISITNSGKLHYDTRLQIIWPDVWQLILGP